MQAVTDGFGRDDEMIACDSCLVRNRAICAVLDSAEIVALNRIGRTRAIQAGRVLMWEGDDSLLVANVVEGVLKLSTGIGDGREQIVGIVYPGDFIGRPFGPRSQHTVTALTDARVCTFTRGDFDAFAREHPELEHKLLQRTLTELDRARHWMLLLGRKSASEKIASFLLDMADRMGESGCGGDAQPLGAFTLPFGRQQVADILGLTIETVSRQLTLLRAAHVIDLPGRRDIAILRRDALEAMAG
jgi:CRP/FNR family transcriptional regulator, anaerobic regulatory protein